LGVVVVPSLSIVNASDRWDGITKSVEPFQEGLSSLGFSVTWFQCVDCRGRPYLPEGGVIVRGLGFPSRTVDMGVNRLWVFPRRVKEAMRSEYVLIADPTLVNVAPSSARLIATIHDLRPLSRYSDRIVTRLMFRYALPRLKNAWRVIVPTAVVRQQLVEMGFDPEKVKVVPETHDLGFHPDHVERSRQHIKDQREIRVLFVGADRRYKNVEFVLRLANEMKQRTDRRYLFTIVSRPRRSTLRLIRSLGLDNVRVLSDVANVSTIYERSDVLVLPSLYEGFGRPLIESMAFGIPILANRIPPLSEVLGDAGVLLDINNLVRWTEALGSLSDPAVFESHAQRSLKRGEAYLPDRFRMALSTAMGDL
jgi:glycosyltransferase involved in cell wall biosynthesis